MSDGDSKRGTDAEGPSGADESNGTESRRRSRRAFLAAGATASLVTFAGCTGGDGTATPAGDGTEPPTQTPTVTSTSTDYPDEVVIGSVHPFTGSTSYVGDRLHKAIRLAATIKNENGGIQSMDGAEVTVIKGDHKNDPAIGGEVTGELIDRGADILTGTYSSPVTNAATRVSESEGVPFVINISVAASLLQERDLNYVYRAQPNSWSQSAHHIDGLTAVSDQAELDIETVGLFYVDTTYGQAIRDGLERAIEGTDMEVVETATIGFGETADSQVTRFRQADPDALFPTVFTNQMLELVTAMEDQNYWPDVLAACASGGLNSENFQKMGSVINGALSSGYQIDLTQEKAQRINERYMQTFDTAPMKGNIGMAYTTAEVLIEAFEQAGSADPEVLRRTLDEITVDEHIMAMPPISFTETGENANPLSVMNQVQDLENRVIYPEQYATTEVEPELIGRN
jgi:branched-chain amino acid transport system substrate-binding protein